MPTIEKISLKAFLNYKLIKSRLYLTIDYGWKMDNDGLISFIMY